MWSSGRWCVSKVFRDKEDTGQSGKKGEDIPRAAERRRNAQTQMKAGPGALGGEVCGVVGRQLEGQCALKAVSGVAGKAGAPDI